MMRRKRQTKTGLRIDGIIALIMIMGGLLIGWMADQAAAHDVHEVNNPETLLFLGNQSLPPICYIKNDAPAGVVVDLANAMAKRMERIVEIRLINWSEAQNQVLDGRADALLQINSNPERLKRYDFSEPLLTSEFTIFTSIQRQGINSMIDLRGLRVGVEEKGLPILLLKQDPQIVVHVIPDFTKGFEMMTSGGLDAIVADRWVGSYILAEKGIRDVKLIDSPISQSYSAIAVKKGNRILLDEINKALIEIKADGTYDRIVHSWQSQEIVFKTREQLRLQAMRFAVITVLLVVALAGIVLLIRENKRRRNVENKLRASEERFRLFMDNSPAIAWMKDEEGRHIYFSKAFINRFDVCVENWLGKKDDDLWPADVAEEFQKNDLAVLAGGQPIQIVEKAANPDGSFGYWLSCKFPILDASGKRYIGGVGIDITEQKKTEALNRQLEKVQRQIFKTESLNRMAGAIAHHFNNQLYVIIGNLEFLLETAATGSENHEMLTDAMSASRKAADISNMMRIYIGQTDGNKELLDLSEICRKALQMVQAAVPETISIRKEIPIPGPAVRANTKQLLQIIIHLITNAWEAISDRQGNITVSVKTVSDTDIPVSNRFPVNWHPKESRYACLEVVDTGCGIQKDDFEKIFDPFFTTKLTGRGLGLSVVLGILGTHGGAITVETGTEGGCTFRVLLPQHSGLIPVDRENETSPEVTQESGAVLLIDDQESVRNMAGTMLSRQGFTVLKAANGAEAIEIFRRHQDSIRLVISDLLMPRMNGWETLTELRKLSPGLPVILSSGYDEAQVMEDDDTPELPDAFLEKPYRLKEMRETIRQVLTKRKDAEK